MTSECPNVVYGQACCSRLSRTSSFGSRCGAAALAIMLSACDSVPMAGVQYAMSAWADKDSSNQPALSPQFDYLRVAHPGGVAWLVLGMQEPPHGGGDSAATEAWFSGQGQVLRLRDGRLTTSTGMPVDWSVTADDAVPGWKSLARQGSGTYLRTRHHAPSYGFKIQDIVKVSRAAAPPPGWLSRVPGMDPSNWAWFTEDSINLEVASASPDLPRAWFGVDMSKDGFPVMASVQCLQVDFCLDIQIRPRPR
jgi:hypothetical protein